jgi:hypothetical protein
MAACQGYRLHDAALSTLEHHVNERKYMPRGTTNHQEPSMVVFLKGCAVFTVTVPLRGWSPPEGWTGKGDMQKNTAAAASPQNIMTQP